MTTHPCAQLLSKPMRPQAEPSQPSQAQQKVLCLREPSLHAANELRRTAAAAQAG